MKTYSKRMGHWTFMFIILIALHGIAFASPSAYISNILDDSVSVIDTATDTVITDISVGEGPAGVAVNSSGTRAYVANFDSDNVSIIDTSTNTVITTITAGDGPWGVAVNPFETRVYVTNVNSDNVSIIDTSTNTVITTITAGDGPWGVAVNPFGTRAYVTNYYKDNVSVIDTRTNTVITTITVGNQPKGIAVNPSGTRAYVANYHSDNVSVIDTSTDSVITSVPVGTYPTALGQFIVPWTIWRGLVSIPIKYTFLKDDPSGDSKFSNRSETSTGTIELYEGGRIPNRIKFLVPENWVLMDIRSIAYIATDVSKSKTDQFLLVGTGDCSIADGTGLTGPAYLDAKGTLKKNNSGDVTSISINGKISGVYSSELIFSGSFKSTLTK